jgi:hypothetical protein|tara:strand:+ start:735 stop:1232 length:498 start_codon:yes stop_codon:yes gene_type:complete
MKLHDLVKKTKAHKADEYSFFLDLQSWRKFNTRYKLKWEKMQFLPTNQKHIPKERGVYAFSVALASSNLPDHGYIMYVGITGLTEKSGLFSRFGQYIREARGSGRPRVVYMLQNWSGTLVFNFARVTDKRVSLQKLESALLDSLRPPINILDFSADITAVRKATF